MKNKINKSLLFLFLVFGTVMVSLAQGPPPPPDPLGNPGTPTPLQSTGAPISDGVCIFLVLAGVYGASKYFQARKQVKTA
jgi:hypothetical protein